MACGLPIVTSEIENMRAMVPDGAGIHVPADDSAQLAQAIRRLAADGALRERMGAVGQRHTQKYDLRCRAAGLLAWLQETAAIAVS